MGNPKVAIVIQNNVAKMKVIEKKVKVNQAWFVNHAAAEPCPHTPAAVLICAEQSMLGLGSTPKMAARLKSFPFLFRVCTTHTHSNMF